MAKPPSPLNDELNEIRRRVESLVRDLTPEQIMRRPDPAKWSIAECLAHLNITAAVVQRFMAQGIQRGKRDKILGQPPFSLGPKGRLLIWIAEPPPKFRMPAPKSIAPPVEIQDSSQVFADFMRVQDDWARLMKEAEGIDLGRISVGPRFSPFRCRLSAAFPWMMAHQRRHLLQAENVKEQLQARAVSNA
ncbi:MAG TPA: DinB family protein [Candidatus Angelobacter sp.]|nr:DinB family protein [Candidatus Angelobacter sp.]